MAGWNPRRRYPRPATGPQRKTRDAGIDPQYKYDPEAQTPERKALLSSMADIFGDNPEPMYRFSDGTWKPWTEVRDG